MTHEASGSCSPAGWLAEASQRLANRYRVGKRWQLGFHPHAKGNPRRMAQDLFQGKRPSKSQGEPGELR